MKNFSQYLNRIRYFSRSCNVTIKIIGNGTRGKRTKKGRTSLHNDDCGDCDPRARTIRIKKDLSESSKLAVLLHELGHFYDFFQKPDSITLARAYNKYLNGEPVTRNQRRLIVDCEISAWDSGDVIAKILNIPLGKWFYKERAEGINYYRSIKIK